MMPADPGNPADTDQPVSLVEAAASLGLDRESLRYYLVKAGFPPAVGKGGRSYLTIPVAEANRILAERRRLNADIGLLPGWSAAEVARRLGIQQATVYRLRQLGKLPAAYEVRAIGSRRWRWDPETVRAYAERVGRTLAE